ncbi:PAS domain S-box protein [Rhodoferax sp.]|uniref:PAS domain-containing sensor histidine kinase n=1 Tax=Rhodoferax sp. TaxID=50421 RepID=UPI0027552A2D|nr:PAS domain S-box protein [Rhodoferax sp.]
MKTHSTDSTDPLQICYRMLFERNPLPMCVVDGTTLRVLAVNEAAVSQYGYSMPEFVELTLLDLHHEDEHPLVREHFDSPLDDRSATRLWRHRHRNGALIEVEAVTQHVDVNGVRAHMVLFRDMTEQRRVEAAQRVLTERLTATLESITDAFFTLDRDWCFTYVNPQAERLLRHSRDEMLGHNIWEVFPEAVGSTFQTEYELATIAGTSASFEALYAPWKVWLAVKAYPSDQGLAAYFHDVTEQRLNEQRLGEERETLAAVVNSTNDGVISVDSQGLIQTFNPGAERIFGRAATGMRGQSLAVLMPERFRAAHAPHIQAFVQSDVHSRMMGLGLIKGLRADGQELDLEGTIAKVTVQDQPMLLVNLRDVTARVLADAEFEQSRAQLSDLTQRLMTQEKALVKRLAQSLHDQLGQTMAAIRMAHETVVAVQAGQVSPEVDRLQSQLGMLIGQAIRQVRQVLIDLRPPLLEEQGLASALDNELRNRSLVLPKVDFSIDAAPEVTAMRWPSDVEYAAFMVAREAIENALRHSGSGCVAIWLSGGPLSLKLEVIDEGSGIPVGATRRNGHLGILGMHERANAVGATVTIDSDEANGTRMCFGWQPPP